MANKKSAPASAAEKPDERLDLAALPMPAVDPDHALAGSKTVADHLADLKTLRRLQALPADEFDHAALMAYAGLHATAMEKSSAYASAENAEGDALVPLSTAQALPLIRTRLYNLVWYHLGDDPEVARELAIIRAGHGYKDTADDIAALLVLREKHLDVLKHDKKNFVQDDAVEGPKHCAVVHQARFKGQRPATRKAGSAWAVAFYALREAHDEIIAAGRYLDRKRPDVDARWPSLYAKPKKSPKRKVGSGGPGA